jgi:hypothetical protein
MKNSKKQAISFQWPAILSDFSQDTSAENFSRGKLKVFFKGETEDHRYFSDKFASELVQTLPYTPVVSYYDEEKEDFVGHAIEQQIYGIVDPRAPYSFEVDEEGKEWCVCDVVLYTERPDKTGEIAKKIIGHKHSLELDPKTAKYKINYDEKKHFKNIEFTAGRFVGVSVLGNDQSPAFRGSEFFSFDKSNDFTEKMQILKDYCEYGITKEEKDSKEEGGIEMQLQDFMALTWGDISLKVSSAVYQEYEQEYYVEIIDFYDNKVVCRMWSYVENKAMLVSIDYSILDSGEVELGIAQEVYVTYTPYVTEQSAVEEDVVMTENDEAVHESINDNAENINVDETLSSTLEEVDNIQTLTLEADDEVTFEEDIVATEEENTDVKVEEVESEVSETFNNAEETTNETTVEVNCAITENVEENDLDVSEEINVEETTEDTVNTFDVETEDATITSDNSVTLDTNINVSAQESFVEIAPSEKERVDNENFSEEEGNSGSTSFTDSERAEFEALKREKKVNLLNSYKEELTDEEYNLFMSSYVDNPLSEFDSLELELLKTYKRHIEEESVKPQMRVFAFTPKENKAENETTLDSFVRKNLRR